MDYSPLWLSLRVAVLATLMTFILGVLAAWLTVKLRRGKGIVDGLFTLPLVLPPTLVGFFLLLMFGKHGFIGQLLNSIGAPVVFTWAGAVIASTVVADPLTRRRILKKLPLVFLMPIYRVMVFFFRFSGFLIALSEQGAWRVENPIEQTRQGWKAARAWLRGIFRREPPAQP